MAGVYASAVATTILQLKEVPPRPPTFDGAICLFDRQQGEAEIRQVLGQYGPITSCELDVVPPGKTAVVRFATHAAARAARAAGPWAGLCGGVDMLYNERSYDGRDGDENGRESDSGRGWCCFEGAVSDELLARLRSYPKLRTVLDTLPPKMLSLASDRPATPVVSEETSLAIREETVIERIRRATFTGAGDKETVPDLYRAYVASIVGALQNTLGDIAAAQEGPAETEALPPLPVLALPPLPPPPPRLADGQLVLMLAPGTEKQQWLSGGEGARHLAIVGGSSEGGSADGVALQSASFILSEQRAELSWDALSHIVLPLPPGLAASFADAREAQEASLRRDIELLRSLRSCGQRGVAVDKPLLERLQRAAPPMAEIASALKGWSASRRAAALEQSALEGVGAELLRSSALGSRPQYAVGQPLMVRVAAGRWSDGRVSRLRTDGQHDIRLSGPAADHSEHLSLLHPWNHAPCELPLTAFDEMRRWYVDCLRVQHSHLLDAISGRRLDVLQQCVAIDVEAADNLTGVRDAASLVVSLHAVHVEWCIHGHAGRSATILMTGRPAAGKTSLLSQVIVHSLDSADSEGLVPILIRVQLLQTQLLESDNARTFSSLWNWADAYLYLEHGESNPALYHMLRQAMMARRALLMIDGLDEGGAMRDEIERHVAEVLALQGHTLLCTSRPDGLDAARFANFGKLHLAPLSADQQQQALEQRLGAERAAALRPYLERVPLDSETGQRITSNPLMLSMVASIFELREGLRMPETVVETYELATSAMLARAGASDAGLTPLLQAVFFEAQCAQTRVITLRHLDGA